MPIDGQPGSGAPRGAAFDRRVRAALWREAGSADLTRRTFLAAAALPAQGQDRVRARDFPESPAAGTAVIAQAYYTAASGGRMIRSNNVTAGRTRWMSLIIAIRATMARVGARRVSRRRESGGRKACCAGIPGAALSTGSAGAFIEFWVQGILPHDDPLEGMREWNVFYRAGQGGETGDHYRRAPSSTRGTRFPASSRARTW